MLSSSSRQTVLLLPALSILFLFFLVPVSGLLLRSFMEPVPGVENYIRFLTDPTYLNILLNTFMVASIVTAFTVVIGFPVAWALAIMPRKISSVIFAIIILSMWTNLLARTYAWMVLLQRTGLVNKTLMALGLIEQPLPLVNNLTGVTIGMTYIMLPVFIIPIAAVMRELDPRIMQAAALCGASRSQVFIRIFLPLLSTSILSGAILIFVMSLGYFITPALLGSTSHMMLGELIAQLIQSLVDWGMGGTAAFVLLLITTALYLAQLKLLKSRREQWR